MDITGFVALARRFGGDGVLLEKESDLPDAIQQAEKFRGPFLIDARISPSLVSDSFAKLYFGQKKCNPLLRPPSRTG